MKNSLIYIAAFLAFWSILAERITTASSLAGLVIAVIIYSYINESYKDINIAKSLKLFPKWLKFLGQLISEIVVANIQVAMIVLSKDMQIAPEVVEYETELDSDILKTILANSITLTPGTMSVDIEGNTLKVHCLNNDYAKSLKENIFEMTLVQIQEAYHDK